MAKNDYYHNDSGQDKPAESQEWSSAKMFPPSTPDSSDAPIQNIAQNIQLLKVMDPTSIDQADNAVHLLMQGAQDEISTLILQQPDISLADAILLVQQQQIVYQAALEVGQRAISSMNLLDYTQ